MQRSFEMIVSVGLMDAVMHRSLRGSDCTDPSRGTATAICSRYLTASVAAERDLSRRRPAPHRRGRRRNRLRPSVRRTSVRRATDDEWCVDVDYVQPTETVVLVLLELNCFFWFVVDLLYPPSERSETGGYTVFTLSVCVCVCERSVLADICTLWAPSSCTRSCSSSTS